MRILVVALVACWHVSGKRLTFKPFRVAWYKSMFANNYEGFREPLGIQVLVYDEWEGRHASMRIMTLGCTDTMNRYYRVL